MSFPHNNGGLPDGSAPINGGGMDGQFPPATGVPEKPRLWPECGQRVCPKVTPFTAF